MQLFTEVSGLLASILGFLVWLPQARRVWQDRHDPSRLVGISVQTQVLSLAGNLLWLLHAIGIGSFWLGAPSVINIPVILLTIALVHRAATAALVDDALQALVPEHDAPAFIELPVLTLPSAPARDDEETLVLPPLAPEEFARAV